MYIKLLQVSGNEVVNGSFNITYNSGVTFCCTYSCSNDSPSKFDYTVKGKNPKHYAIEPSKPEIHHEGDETTVSLNIVSPPKYRFDITNSTGEISYIKEVSAGDWDPSFPSEIPILETVSGMVNKILKLQLKNVSTLSQVTGDGALSGSFKINYKSGVTFNCTYSSNKDSSPSTFEYTIEGDNPNHYAIKPDKPEIHYVGDETRVFLSVVSPPKYHFDIMNNTEELAYIKDVSDGNWNPALPSEIPIFESASGTVLLKI